MLEHLNRLMIVAYVHITEGVCALRDDERGLSGVVVAVMLILVAVLSIAMLWGFLSGWLADQWEIIIGNSQLS